MKTTVTIRVKIETKDAVNKIREKTGMTNLAIISKAVELFTKNDYKTELPIIYD